MSVVEKAAPRRRLLALLGGVVLLVAMVIGAIALIDGSPRPDQSAAGTSTSSPSASITWSGASSTPPATEVAETVRTASLDVSFDAGSSYRVYLQRAVTIGSAQVFGIIDMAKGELRQLDRQRTVVGTVVGRFGEMLVLQSMDRLRIVDRDFARSAVSIPEGDHFVGAWRDNAIVAEFFTERSTFHEYDQSGRAVRSVALVGRAPDVIGGVVRGSVVVERAGRLLLLSLSDSSVRELAIGRLLGVGGDRIFYTACSMQGSCQIHEATLEGTVRTIPIGPYAMAGADGIHSRVAPDGSAVVLDEPRTGAEVVFAGGALLTLSAEGGPRDYSWAPSGRLFVVDGPNRTLDVVDYRTGRTVSVALPSDVTAELHSVAVF